MDLLQRLKNTMRKQMKKKSVYLRGDTISITIEKPK